MAKGYLGFYSAKRLYNVIRMNYKREELSDKVSKLAIDNKALLDFGLSRVINRFLTYANPLESALKATLWKFRSSSVPKLTYRTNLSP